MQVILQSSIVNLGKVGDVVKVAPGYARNFLFPKKMALPVTEENQKILNEKRALLEKEEAKILASLQEQAKKMQKLELSCSVQAHEDGRLFGSIGLAEIKSLIETAGFDVDKKSLHIAQGAIKAVGKYDVIVQLHAEVKFELPLVISAENVSQEDIDRQTEIEGN
jgi:large subunit ribosomal protein L9